MCDITAKPVMCYKYSLQKGNGSSIFLWFDNLEKDQTVELTISSKFKFVYTEFLLTLQRQITTSLLVQEVKNKITF